MPNEVLVKYIEKEWKKKIPPSEIKRRLVAKGWKESKVEEAFDYILEYRSNEFSHPPPKKPDNFKRNVIIALVILITLGGGSYTYVFYGDAIIENIFWGPTTCGEDYQCFIQQASSCSEASVSRTETENVFGAEQTITSRFETEKTDGKCLLTITWREISTEFPSGTSASVKQAREITLNSAEGLEAKCTLEVDKLSSLLAKWRDEGVSFTDLQVNGCQGSMMNPPRDVRKFVI